MMNAFKQVRQAMYGFVKRRGQPLQVSGLSDEILDGVRLMQQVGFASDLPVDTQVVMLPIGGRATNMVIIASSDAPIVVKAGEGETVIYDSYVINEGYVWISYIGGSGQRNYIATGEWAGDRRKGPAWGTFK